MTRLIDNILKRRYAGRSILIVGVGSGLGKALVENLEDLGIEFIGLTSTGSNDKFSHRRNIFKCDLSQLDEIDQVVSRLKKSSKPFSSVFFVSGIAEPVRARDFTFERLSYIFNVNVLGFATLLVSLLKNNCLEGRVSIVPIASGAAVLPAPTISLYAASKAALVKLCESLHYELNDEGVSFSIVFPGKITKLKSPREAAYKFGGVLGWYQSPMIKAKLLLLLSGKTKKVYLPGSYLVAFAMYFFIEKIYKKLIINKLR